MNKAELIAKIAETGLSKRNAAIAVEAVINAISTSLANGETVQLLGFGTFDVREHSARSGRNPRTGEVIEIKASKVPGFKPGKALKEKVK